MLARMSHPMHTYLLGRRRIRAFVARLTRTQTDTGKGKRGARMPITGLTSASEPKHTQEGKHGARTPITGLTSASEPKHTHTRTRMPLDGLTSASKHTTTQQVNRESGTRAYNCQAHTQTNRRRIAKESGTRA